MAKFQGGSAAPVYLVDSVTGSIIAQPTTSIADPTTPTQKAGVDSSGNLFTRLGGDAIPGAMWSVDATLGAADAVSSYAIPAGARGYRIYNGAARIRVAINADPPASFTTTNTTPNTGTAYLGAYNSVAASAPEIRLFQQGATNTTLRVNSETLNATFTLEFF